MRSSQLWAIVDPGTPFELAIVDHRLAEAYKAGRISARDAKQLTAAVRRQDAAQLRELGYSDD